MSDSVRAKALAMSALGYIKEHPDDTFQFQIDPYDCRAVFNSEAAIGLMQHILADEKIDGGTLDLAFVALTLKASLDQSLVVDVSEEGILTIAPRPN